MRAAKVLENSRSTLMTGMPASIALIATSVSAAPSVGSSTIASTPSLMKVSTWLICRLASFVPSATISSMSGYFAASAMAAELMAPSQPWSAAGPEKPMVIGLAGLVVVGVVGRAVVPPPPPAVQPASRPAIASAPAATSRRLRVASMCFLLGGGSRVSGVSLGV